MQHQQQLDVVCRKENTFSFHLWPTFFRSFLTEDSRGRKGVSMTPTENMIARLTLFCFIFLLPCHMSQASSKAFPLLLLLLLRSFSPYQHRICQNSPSHVIITDQQRACIFDSSSPPKDHSLSVFFSQHYSTLDDKFAAPVFCR